MEGPLALDASHGILRGHPTPLGATVRPGGVNFSIFSRHATDVHLVICSPWSFEPIAEFRLDPRRNRTGDIWHAFVPGARAGTIYGWRVDGPSGGPLHRFDGRTVLIDPFARALTGAEHWGRRHPDEPAGIRPRRSVVVDDEFDWADDHPLNIHLADTLIYEMHVRGFTRHESSGVEHPGSFQAVIDKIPYLKELGVTAVELMPVAEFEELDNERRNPLTGEPLLKYWGYDPIVFFAPKASYATRPEPALAVREFKHLVKALHAAGIEVLLDVVFNHTAEGNELGPTLSLRGFENSAYYIIDRRTGGYMNYSGCGNTVNANHPAVRTMILEALRYWVTEMHVDGFRFDLASILGRGQDGSPLANPPLIERIAGDPVLANTKLIAEAWDAAGLYQVGTFPNWGRWAEWNGKFRDDLRRFVRGDGGLVGSIATRLAGSSDLYSDDGRAPYHSVNFVTSHDGFTLRDLVSYSRRYNDANGEQGRDGTSDDYPWNCGHEGEGAPREVETLRARQQRNLAALMLLSQGVPMILAGDEMGRTQGGNNNAYCQDNPVSWLDWRLLERNRDLFRFFKVLIRYRHAHPILRRRTFFDPPPASAGEIGWHGPKLNRPDWSADSRTVSMHLLGGRHDHDLLVIANMQENRQRFELPTPSAGKRWHRFVDTSLPSPLDAAEDEAMTFLGNVRSYDVSPRTVVVLVGR
jgi:glycogen operon protein